MSITATSKALLYMIMCSTQTRAGQNLGQDSPKRANHSD